ncbi:MAG: SpoIIE family protein phosphatase [Clostridia bacterium]|nr:SpoIIE family protein phosphatase [Clostridia bacterium]
MNKKPILYTSYFVIFLLLFFAEKNMGIRPFALGFFMALLFCRQNILVLCPLYAVASMLVSPTAINLVFALCPCAVTLSAYFLHYKLKKKITMLFLSIYTFLSCLPLLIMFTADIYQITNTVITLLGAEAFMFCCATFLQPLLTRGLKYKLRHEERLSLFLFLTALFTGVSYFEPFGFAVLYTVAVFAIILCKQTLYPLTLTAASVFGLSYAIASQSFFALALLVCLALVAMSFKRNNIYVTVAGVILAFFGINYFFGCGVELMTVLPPVCGGALALFVPAGLVRKIKKIESVNLAGFSTRTLLNRDRGDVAKRLDRLSQIFYDIQDILKADLNRKKTNYDEKLITREICNKCCNSCPNSGVCREKIGDTSYAVSGLVLAAMESGKATLLDTPPMLTSQCKRVNTLINSTNDIVSRYKKRQQIEQSIEQGREMIITQMGGVGLILEKLGEDMRACVSYDTLLEKGIFEELCRVNILADDIIVFGRNKRIDRITLNVKEGDAERAEIAGILSDMMQQKMIEHSRENNIKGNIVLHYIVAPAYDIVYGDMALAKEQQCGDNRKAERISEDKIMLILSDGMGSGQRAYDASMNAVLMIESFYKAGFDHNTVLSCVGRLLGLREEEEFNALDIVVIDVRNGTADFIKQGGRESFILSNGGVEVIQCGSLPLGIIEETYPIVEQRKLSDGDIIVLISDGIADSLGVDMVKEILLTSDTVNPQVFAELIVNNAERMCGSSLPDDMSCMAARVIKTENKL